MASSTPTPPHCTITAPKPFHPNSQTYPPHLSLPSRSNGSASKSTPPVPLSQNPSNTFPSLSKSSTKPQQLPSNFSGRRSTRFVSKMHLGRPKTAVTSRHSSVAEEALREASRIHNNDDKALQSLLLYFEPKLSGSEDYNFLLRGLGNSGECSKALRCFEFAVQREKRKVEQGKLASSMISILGRLGKVDLARSVFEDAVSKGYGNTVYAFSALISAYGRSGYCNEAIKVFESMKGNGLKPNLVTYNAIIDACGKGGMEFSRASEILDEMLMNGVHPDRITFNSLLAVCSRSGLWEAARDLFSEMVCRGIDPDIFTYNTLIDAFCKGGQMDLAYQIMSEMSSRNIMPNVVTYSTMIDGYAKIGRLEEAVNLLEDMKLAGVGLDRVSYNNLLSIYAKLGRFEEVVNVCKEMESSGIKKDAVTYNALLSGYGKQGKYEEVMRVFQAMKAERISPNLLTYSTLIDVYSKGGLHQEAMEVFRDFKRAGLKADVVLYSALIDALCKNGMVEAAVSLLDEMTNVGIKPNVVTYNSIIDAFGREATQDGPSEPASSSSKLQIVSSSEVASEDGKEQKSEDNRLVKIFGQVAADKLCRFNKDSRGNGEMLSILGIFHKMHELKIQPNVVTFSAILTACSRCNSFEDASMLLEELRSFDNQVYGVAHGLLMGRRDRLWVQAQSLFDEVKNMDSSTASAFYNALTDMLWHFGQKQGAQLVVLEGKRRHVWENVWSDSCLDLHLMSSGAARAMVHAWLLDIRSIVFEGHELPKLISILTGWGKHSKVVGDGALRRAIEALLTSIGAPFWVAECNLGRFISSGPVVTAWLKESSTLRVLVLRDDRTHQEGSRLDKLPKLQALSL